MREELDAEVEMVRGAGGVYTVVVDGQVVARKSLDHGFPTEAQVVAAVREALAQR